MAVQGREEKEKKLSNATHIVQGSDALFVAIQNGVSAGIERWHQPADGRWEYQVVDQGRRMTAGLQIEPKTAPQQFLPDFLITDKQATQLLTSISDGDVDTFYAACEIWRLRASHATDPVFIAWDELLELFGIERQKSGDGHETYRIRDRARTQSSFLRFVGMRCYEAEAPPIKLSRRKPGGSGQQQYLTVEPVNFWPVFLIVGERGMMVQAGEETENGTLIEYGQSFVKTGVWFMPAPPLARHLKDSPQEWALLATKSFEYRDHSQRTEKRLTRFLGLMYRRRFRPGSRDISVTVAELVEALQFEADPRYPKRKRMELEDALNTLAKDTTIIGDGGWTYLDEVPDLADNRLPKGWYQDLWLPAKIVVSIPNCIYEAFFEQRMRALQAPQDVAAHAEPIAALTSGGQAKAEWSPERMRAVRSELKLSQRAFGQLLGLSGPYVNMMEKGAREITAEVEARLDGLVKNRQQDLVHERLTALGAVGLQAEDVKVSQDGQVSLQLSWLMDVSATEGTQPEKRRAAGRSR